MTGLCAAGAVGGGISAVKMCPTNISCMKGGSGTNVPFVTLLCMRCLELEEPPWWPNNRDMCHEWLLQEFRKTALPPLDTHICRRIAEYIAENMPDVAEDHPVICGEGCAEVRPAANTCMFG